MGNIWKSYLEGMGINQPDQTCEGPASYRKVFQESEQDVSHILQAESSEVFF